MSRSVLHGIVGHLKSEPSRTWSIIVTVFGDAIVPRGGSVWLGTLLSFFEALDIGSGVVRTAMSRLAADGWLERRRIGKNSFYRLTEMGRETFAAATDHIYSLRTPSWDGSFRLILTENGKEREAARAQFEEAGFGSLAPTLWVAPPGAMLPEAARGPLRLDTRVDRDTGRKLVAKAWPLGRMQRSYTRFLATFAALDKASAQIASLSDLDAFVARILMIHQFRRIILHDPVLPAELLPVDWPGREARELCARLYHALLPASERWLDRNGLGEDGKAMPEGEALRVRFRR
jgi:phenylacetic acid degradation operon negative regulatory protein